MLDRNKGKIDMPLEGMALGEAGTVYKVALKLQKTEPPHIRSTQTQTQTLPFLRAFLLSRNIMQGLAKLEL